MALPETATRGARRRWPLYVLVAVALVALALLVEAFLRTEDFSPGEEISSPSIQDVAVSEEDSLYPPPDMSRFTARPGTIFVYLSVEDVPSVEDMGARVERSGSGSAFSLFQERGSRIQVLDEQEDQLSNDEQGASGIIKFALKTSSGEPVPPGNYTLEISEGPGQEGTAVRKLFIVEG